MYSREESKLLRKEFWILFGETYPRKWLLYNTKIKDVTLKFTFDTQKAQVSIDIEPKDVVFRTYYYERLLKLKNILISEYLNDIIYEENYLLDNGKEISRLYVELKGVNIHNKKCWDQTMIFLNDHMSLLESFFIEYKDFIKE